MKRLGWRWSWGPLLAAVMGLMLTGAAGTAQEARPVRVTATTSLVADLVRQIGGERVTVTSLMGAGVDPHLYKATAADLLRLERAEILFYSGLHLEGKMQDLLEKLARRRPVIAITADVPPDRLLRPPEAGEHPDPHVWLDASLWAQCVDSVVRGLTQVRPADSAWFAERGGIVKQRLTDLHTWALEKAAELPANRRVLVTSHDAYSYFGRAYGFEVVGLQGISTVAEAGLADMTRLVDFIRQRGVRAIFVESSISPATLKRISQDSGARIGGELYSDALGAPGQMVGGNNVGTYEGMFRHNLTTIVEALR